MDARARSRLGVLIAPLALAACGARARPTAAPQASAPANSSPAAPSPTTGGGGGDAQGAAAVATPTAGTAIDASFRSRFAKIGEPVRSLGHAGGLWRIQRWADDGGRRALDGAAAPAGATIVAELLDAGGGPGPVLAMQKQPPGWDGRGGDWSWTVLSTAGEPLRAGKLADCSGCHALARRDRVYGAR